MSLIYEENRDRIDDDYTLLEVARDIHSRMKPLMPTSVYSKVARVDYNFYITPRLEIAVPSVKVLFQKDIREPSLIRNILTGGLAHEDGHAYLFPFMTRMNLTYAVIHGYVKSRNVKWDEGVFHTVENMVSDVFNELIIYYNKVPGWDKLPELRYHYIFKNVKEAPPDPVSELLYVHSKVFASMYNNKLSSPRVPSPRTIGENLYNILSEAARMLNVDSHVVSVNSGGLKSEIAPLVFQYDMYSNVDYVYDLIEKSISTKNVRTTELWRALLNDEIPYGNRKVYWAYYTTLTALYRYVIEHPQETNCKNIDDMNVDTGATRPSSPAPDVLDKILRNMNISDILSPELADYAARRLISAVLSVSKEEIESVMTTSTTKAPWYRRPRGKIDPRSLVYDNVMDWKVVVKSQVPDYKKKTVSIAGVPDSITIIIDESGSTSSESTVLSPVVGIETYVYDVERVTAMALLYNVLRFSNDVKTNLVRFSSSVRVEPGTVASIYDRLKNITGSELEMGGTNITGAVEKALEIHKDGRTNYFILLTDMEISWTEAEKIYNDMISRLRLSPVLVVAANANVPEPLARLNRFPNSAAVSVRTIADYPSLEEAIFKLAKLMHH